MSTPAESTASKSDPIAQAPSEPSLAIPDHTATKPTEPVADPATTSSTIASPDVPATASTATAATSVPPETASQPPATVAAAPTEVDVPGPVSTETPQPSKSAPPTTENSTEPSESAPAAAEPEDDDDLDDLLDEFAEGKAPKPTTGAVLEKAAEQPPITAVDMKEVAATAETVMDDDFAAQLQAGMADLLGELETSPELQQQFEKLVKEFGAGQEAAAGSSQSAPGQPTSEGGEPNFQDSILKTMQRMQESGQQASAAAATDTSDDLLAELLKQMDAGDLEGGAEEGFSKLLLGMMEQLTNKEILYEPMKELHTKFPEWIEKNRGTLSKEDLDRYTQQQVVVAEIVQRFELPTYSDNDSSDREYIVERMQKMQAAGAPPPDLVGDMSAAQDALGDLDSSCPQQ